MQETITSDRPRVTSVTFYGQLYSSKNSKQMWRSGNTGRMRPTKSKASRRYDKNTQPTLEALKHMWLEMITGKPYPLKLSFKIYRKTSQAFDYVNIIQGLLDSMVDEGYLLDDNADYLLPIFEPYEIDPSNPRVIVTAL